MGGIVNLAFYTQGCACCTKGFIVDNVGEVTAIAAIRDDAVSSITWK